MRMSNKKPKRLMQSYEPIRNPLTELLGIDDQKQVPLLIYCKVTHKLIPSEETYVKQYMQNIDPRTLHVNSFRSISKLAFDEKNRNNKKGFGWKTNEQLQIPTLNLELFINDKVDCNE